MAEALYRKYRPKIFEDVVGQEHIERTLKNAIRTDKVSHAYLFTGPRGTGKTTTARLLAKALLCQAGGDAATPDPDGTCEDCLLIAEGEHPDVSELDAASRTGVENVREEIIGRVNYAPTRGRYKVYIIDEVHMLSTAAFNALLKTLEEPPDHVVFVLCTTDPQKVPETIHSRCQRFDFRRISNEELVSRLGAICEMEGVQFEGDALDLIAHRADGGMRDALTSLEQLMSFGEGNVTVELAERLLGSLDSSDLAEIVRAIGMRDAAAAFRWTSEYMETGADLAQFTQDLSVHMRDMYVMSLAGADVALDISETGRKELQAELPMFGPDRLSNLLGVLGDLASELKTSTNQRLSFEIALTRMMRPDSDITLAALAERIEALEAGVNATLPAQSAPVQITHSEPVRTAEQASVSQEQQKQQFQEPEPIVRKEASKPKEEAVVAQAEPAASREVQPATSATTTATAPSDANALQQLWATAMAHLKKASQAYATLFMNAKPQYDAATEGITVVFASGSDFAFKAVQKPEVRQALSEALAKAGAPGVHVSTEKADDSDDIVLPEIAQTNRQSEPVFQQQAQQLQQASQQPQHTESAVQHVAQQPQSASQQQQIQQPVQQQPAYTPNTPDDEPPFNEVPLSAYEDTGIEIQIDDEPPFDIPNEAAKPTIPAEPSTHAQEPSQSELNEALAAAFGEGIMFTQVDE